MEPLLQQLRALLSRIPGTAKVLLVLAVVGLGAAGAVLSAVAAVAGQSAFTNPTPADSGDAAGALKAAGVPFRMEAGGSALAVPADRVHDARLLLAAHGIPRGAGVGFELFDKGDIGVSDFVHKVNYRRAIEGELARTVSRLSPVRSARVHITLPEKSLFRDEDRKASAAVVVNLQPGRHLEDREVAGIRHLVASAVPGLAAAAVTLVDGKGQVLSPDATWGEAGGYQRKLERDLEQRVVDLLEQAVGPGAVVARVAASLDAAEVKTTAETVDPDATALRSERKVTQAQQQDASGPAGAAGAVANQPLQPQPAVAGQQTRGTSSLQDEIRNYDTSRTTTTTVQRVPRLRRLSVAILLDGVAGKPRPAAEVARLGELAKRAVGFDASRGDELDISSAPFARAEDAGASPPAAAPAPRLPPLKWLVAGGGALLALVLGAAALALRRRKAAPGPVLVPGARVAELEAGLAGAPGGAGSYAPQLPAGGDPAQEMRQRARVLAQQDPARAAQILKAWMSEDGSHA
jgi:flagellar M-ring protein FliF